MNYQLLTFGPAMTACVADLRNEFNLQIKAIGLDPTLDVELIEISSPSDVMRVKWDGAPVGIWFGDSISKFEKHHVELAEDLLKKGHPLFPVCESLSDYQKKVPTQLKHINGQPWSEPEEKSSVVANVLAGFRLTPAERQAFISYRRDESRSVAVQIFEELERRKYCVFLDTASVPAGVSFQEVLTGRLSGMDLVIFLDTQNALSSQWVYQELNQAHTQGMGILQVLWPGRPQSPGTGFCDPFVLRKTEFVNGTADGSDRLQDARLHELIQETERTRIRSIRHRRERVIGEVVTQASHVGLATAVNPVGTKKLRTSHIELYRTNKIVGRIMTVHGLPTSQLIQGRCDDLEKNSIDVQGVRIVYDELGIHPTFSDHLDWLNKRLDAKETIQTQPLTTVTNWMRTL